MIANFLLDREATHPYVTTLSVTGQKDIVTSLGSFLTKRNMGLLTNGAIVHSCFLLNNFFSQKPIW